MISPHGSSIGSAALCCSSCSCCSLTRRRPSADVQIDILQQPCPSTTQAGGHPDFARSTSTLSSHQTRPDPCACNDAKDVTVHLPTGLIGNPHATPQCNIAQFASDQCPVDSQVGVADAAVPPRRRPGYFEHSPSSRRLQHGTRRRTSRACSASRAA